MHFLPPSSFLLGALVGLVELSSQQNFSSSYAPINVTCPSKIQWLRPAKGLSHAESKWVAGRKHVVLNALDGYLQRLGLEDFDCSKYVAKMKSSKHVPTLAIAISGGGYSSSYTATSALRALDNRYPAANQQKTGGLFQAFTYMTGISGGAWPVMSFASYDFPTADQLLPYWAPEIDRFAATNTTQFAATDGDMFGEIEAKQAAGFEITMTDFFGLAWGYQFINGPGGGLNTTLSNIATLDNFKSYNMPFPIILADQITPDDAEYFNVSVPSPNATVFEFSPFELGSWQGPKQFFPTKYMGTTFNNGKPVNTSACVLGFDRGSYILGMAGAAVNFWYIEALSNGTEAPFAKRTIGTPSADNGPAKREITVPLSMIAPLIDVYQDLFHENLTEAVYARFPNPFPAIKSKQLVFADGSEAGQSIPLWPLIQPARQSDFIIAWDGDSDQAPYSWNNGTNLYNTYVQAKVDEIAFPIIPPPLTFIANNWTQKPVFFGCDANLTTTKSPDAPIVLYMANAPYSAYTNYSFFQPEFTNSQMNDIFENGFNQMTQGNSTLDPEWPACLGCAVIERSLAKVGMKRTAQCQSCLQKYCWDGTVYNGEVGVVDLHLALDPSLSFAQWNETHDF